jgi:integrase
VAAVTRHFPDRVVHQRDLVLAESLDVERMLSEQSSTGRHWTIARKKAVASRRVATAAAPKEVPTLETFLPRFVDGYARANRQKHSGISAASVISKGRAYSAHRTALHSPNAKYRDWFRPAARRAELRHVGVHVRRHTFRSHLSMQGAPVRAIQELAGHEEIGMTQRYKHLSPAAIEAAIHLLEHRGPSSPFGDTLETGSPNAENEKK